MALSCARPPKTCCCSASFTSCRCHTIIIFVLDSEDEGRLVSLAVGPVALKQHTQPAQWDAKSTSQVQYSVLELVVVGAVGVREILLQRKGDSIAGLQPVGAEILFNSAYFFVALDREGTARKNAETSSRLRMHDAGLTSTLGHASHGKHLGVPADTKDTIHFLCVMSNVPGICTR